MADKKTKQPFGDGGNDHRGLDAYGKVGRKTPGNMNQHTSHCNIIAEVEPNRKLTEPMREAYKP